MVTLFRADPNNREGCSYKAASSFRSAKFGGGVLGSPALGEGALELWYQTLAVWGPSPLRSLSLSPDVLLFSGAEGSGGRAGPNFDSLYKNREACLLKYRASQGEQAQAKGTRLIFALELFTIVSVLWPLDCAPAGASVVIFVDNDSAAPALC